MLDAVMCFVSLWVPILFIFQTCLKPFVVRLNNAEMESNELEVRQNARLALLLNGSSSSTASLSSVHWLRSYVKRSRSSTSSSSSPNSVASGIFGALALDALQQMQMQMQTSECVSSTLPVAAEKLFENVEQEQNENEDQQVHHFYVFEPNSNLKRYSSFRSERNSESKESEECEEKMDYNDIMVGFNSFSTPPRNSKRALRPACWVQRDGEEEGILCTQDTIAYDELVFSVSSDEDKDTLADGDGGSSDLMSRNSQLSTDSGNEHNTGISPYYQLRRMQQHQRLSGAEMTTHTNANAPLDSDSPPNSPPSTPPSSAPASPRSSPPSSPMSSPYSSAPSSPRLLHTQGGLQGSVQGSLLSGSRDSLLDDFDEFPEKHYPGYPVVRVEDTCTDATAADVDLSLSERYYTVFAPRTVSIATNNRAPPRQLQLPMHWPGNRDSDNNNSSLINESELQNMETMEMAAELAFHHVYQQESDDEEAYCSNEQLLHNH